jgi:hypothetical protein
LLSLWDDVFALVERGQAVPDQGRGGTMSRQAARWVGSRLPEIMVMAYRWAGGDREERDVRTLTSSFTGWAPPPTAEFGAVEVVLASLVCDQLLQLLDHGVVELHGPGLDVTPPLIPGATLRQRQAMRMATTPGIFVRLTPLGRWAVHEVLCQEGAEAPASLSPAGARSMVTSLS